MSDNIDDILESDPVADEADTDESYDEQDTDEGRTDRDSSDEMKVPERPVPSGASTPSDDELGHVLASEEIHVSRRDYQVNAFIRTEARDDIRLGE